MSDGLSVTQFDVRHAKHEFLNGCRSWRLRKPVSPETRDLISIRGRGDSLIPLLPSSATTRLLFDPTLAADDFDLVLVALDPSWTRRLLDDVAAGDSMFRDWWARTYMPTGILGANAVKMLRHGRDGKRWLVGTYGAEQLERMGEVIGVCVYLEVAGRPVLGSIDPHRLQRRLCSLGLGLAAALFFLQVVEVIHG